MSYSAIGIKFPLATYETIKETLPDATVYRTISYLKHDGFIELYYILDTEIFSPKQKSWLGNIKTRIRRKISFVEFVELEDKTVRALSGKIYTLKSLSNIWKKAKIFAKKEETFSIKEQETKKVSLLDKLKDSKEWTDHEILDDELDYIKAPQLVPFMYGGKEHENLYKTLCIYAKRLHYEKLFILEYLELASNLYAQDLQLLRKEVRKITLKAWEFISEEIESHPEDFKQKLSPAELSAVKSASGARLQKYNDTKRADNISLVQDAIASGLHYKSDGASLNVSSLTNATKLNRKTVDKILNAL